MKVIAFPYAGGNSFCYRPLAERLRSELGVVVEVLELPGRGSLNGESLKTDINDLTDYLFHKIRSLVAEPFVLYGHSMGALLAYLVCQRLLSEGLNLPVGIIVSGRKGPLLKDTNLYHRLSHADFLEVLRKMGGCPRPVLEDADLMAYFEPVLRADFQAIETYDPSIGIHRALSLPLVVLVGDQDDISIADSMAWQAVTDLPIAFQVLSGNHFFIHEHWNIIVEHVRKLFRDGLSGQAKIDAYNKFPIESV